MAIKFIIYMQILHKINTKKVYQNINLTHVYKKMRRNLSSQRILFALEFLQNITTTISTQKKDGHQQR